MKYFLNKYKNHIRFNNQYDKIYEFLKKSADVNYNEHFHWGRFEWMMCHTLLDIDKLDHIGIFTDENNSIVGLVTYDTSFNDSTYLIHSIDDINLLTMMIDFTINEYSINNKISIVANSNDTSLIKLLQEKKFVKTDWKDCVLELDLKTKLNIVLPEEYHLSPPNFLADPWQYQILLYRGFDHDGLPERIPDDFFKPTPNFNSNLKVYALNKNNEYCAHCGMWYTSGNTAYIEPVVTIPECRMHGLAKATIYEAVTRSKSLGAKRAVVLSDQEFYYKIGFEKSSEFIHWELML